MSSKWMCGLYRAACCSIRRQTATMWQRCIQRAVTQAVSSARSAGVQAAASRVLANASSAAVMQSSKKAGQSLAQSSVFRAFRQESAQVGPMRHMPIYDVSKAIKSQTNLTSRLQLSMSARSAPCFSASAPSVFSVQPAAGKVAFNAVQVGRWGFRHERMDLHGSMHVECTCGLTCTSCFAGPDSLHL